VTGHSPSRCGEQLPPTVSPMSWVRRLKVCRPRCGQRHDHLADGRRCSDVGLVESPYPTRSSGDASVLGQRGEGRAEVERGVTPVSHPTQDSPASGTDRSVPVGPPRSRRSNARRRARYCRPAPHPVDRRRGSMNGARTRHRPRSVSPLRARSPGVRQSLASTAGPAGGVQNRRKCSMTSGVIPHRIRIVAPPSTISVVR